MCKRILYVLLVIAATAAEAQQYPFTRYGTEDGLPQNHVTSVTMDHRGFLWAATADLV